MDIGCSVVRVVHFLTRIDRLLDDNTDKWILAALRREQPHSPRLSFDTDFGRCARRLLVRTGIALCYVTIVSDFAEWNGLCVDSC